MNEQEIGSNLKPIGHCRLVAVTLGKGLALRVGYRGPCFKAVAKQALLDAPK